MAYASVDFWRSELVFKGADCQGYTPQGYESGVCISDRGAYRLNSGILYTWKAFFIFMVLISIEINSKQTTFSTIP